MYDFTVRCDRCNAVIATGCSQSNLIEERRDNVVKVGRGTYVLCDDCVSKILAYIKAYGVDSLLKSGKELLELGNVSRDNQMNELFKELAESSKDSIEVSDVTTDAAVSAGSEKGANSVTLTEEFSEELTIGDLGSVQESNKVKSQDSDVNEKKSRTCTPDEIQRIIDLYDGGMSVSDIAADVQRSPITVRKHIDAYRLKKINDSKKKENITTGNVMPIHTPSYSINRPTSGSNVFDDKGNKPRAIPKIRFNK